ncbi:hypothetical protein Taro_040758 [Colocasia esculenta]|uniref:Uncharacterized protein n=1 Tax=Colocasia esculenta TaxID=4460 RepID=A0A843WCN5_COLES|nr:hypothetical protein [Colocasia esculenta]
MELPGFVPYLRTRYNLLQSPGSRRALRELPRELHHAATLASTPMPPTETATLCVHIYCRQVHAVNVH